MTTTTKRNRQALGLGLLAAGLLALVAAKARSETADHGSAEASPYQSKELTPLSETDYGKLDGKVDEKKAENLFGAGRVFVGSAATFRLKDISNTQAITGAGGLALQGGYHVVDNVALVAEATTENTGHSVFDAAAGGVQAFIPIKDSGLAPYFKALGGRHFEGDENWFIAGEAGLEVRGKLFGAFLGLRYSYDLESQSDLMVIAGVNLHALIGK